MGSGKLDFGGFRLDPANALLSRRDAPVALAPKPFDVLCRLAERAGRLVTKDELLDAIWTNLNVTESSLSFAIAAIRAALGDDAQAPRYIETVPRRGYRFIAPVTVVAGLNAYQPPEARTWAPFLPSSRPRWCVGRGAALEAADGLLRQSLAGVRQVAFVTGEAGIGKTTFVEMALARMSAPGVQILSCHCVERFGTDQAFLPLIDAIEEHCGGADGAIMLKALRDHAPTWLAQMPRFLEARDRSVTPSAACGTTRERMLREFCELLECLSADRPWIVILEDLQWSDLATLDVLSRFARRDRPSRVLVLATYRPADVLAAGHPVRAVHQDLQIRKRCTEFALDRLSRAEVEQYLASRFDAADMAAALTKQVFKRTQGQPLFVIAFVDHFVAQQIIVKRDGHWCLASEDALTQAGMPRDLREMISRQIDVLGADEQTFLEVASAAGVEFSAAAVAGALERDTAEVEDSFEALTRTRRVLNAIGLSEWSDGTISECYAFQHALYQEVLYHRLAPGRRIAVRRRLGEMPRKGAGKFIGSGTGLGSVILTP